MKLMEFLNKSINIKELTDRLLLLDKSIMELHQNGYYVIGSLSDIEIINNEITLNSFHDKIDRIDSEYDPNGVNKNILEMSIIGICVYNKVNAPINNNLCKYISDNLDKILSYKRIPVNVGKYYQDVINEMHFDYLNSYLDKIDMGGKGDSNKVSKSKSYTKSTAVGRAFSEHDSAYVDVLMIPAIFSLIYVSVIVILLLMKIYG